MKIFQYSGKLKVCLITSGKYAESQSQCPRGLRRGSAAARLQGSWVRIPLAAWNSFVGGCYQEEVSAAGLPLVQRSSTECGVSECDREASTLSRPWPAHWGLSSHKENIVTLRLCGFEVKFILQLISFVKLFG